ncbi:MAG: cytochrome c oxidase subunit II [Gemmatimonadetes bacterium]|nr:cytochrome c oxidase subunit II [Gemmatimonadota bacterium]
MIRYRRSALRAKPLVMLAFAALLAGAVGCQGPFPQSTFDPTTSFGRDLAGLFGLIFWWGVGVFVVVEVGVVYVLIRFRARPDGEQPVPIHGHTALEIAWTLAPAMIIVFIAVPTIQTIWRDAGPAADNPLEVQAIGHQWWWEFRYPEYGIVTANDLHLPQGRAVTVQLTSADVIHSFWVPRLGGKRDMLPGRNNRLSFTPDSVGEFLGQCAEFCGLSHANMRFRAIVHTADDFAAWVAAQNSPHASEDSLSTLEQQGLAAFRAVRTPASNSCIACHAIQNVSFGVLGPNLNHVAGRSTLAAGVLNNTAEDLAAWLRDPAAIKPGSLMPTIGLSQQEITALVAYLRSLR